MTVMVPGMRLRGARDAAVAGAEGDDDEEEDEFKTRFLSKRLAADGVAVDDDDDACCGSCGAASSSVAAPCAPKTTLSAKICPRCKILTSSTAGGLGGHDWGHCCHKVLLTCASVADGAKSQRVRWPVTRRRSRRMTSGGTPPRAAPTAGTDVAIAVAAAGKLGNVDADKGVADEGGADAGAGGETMAPAGMALAETVDSSVAAAPESLRRPSSSSSSSSGLVFGVWYPSTRGEDVVAIEEAIEGFLA